MPTSEGVARAVQLVPDIIRFEMTCSAVPVQIEGTLVDGSDFYFRYRWGHAGVGIGETLHAAVADQIYHRIEYGDEHQGFLDDDELAEVFVAAWAARVGSDGR